MSKRKLYRAAIVGLTGIGAGKNRTNLWFPRLVAPATHAAAYAACPFTEVAAVCDLAPKLLDDYEAETERQLGDDGDLEPIRDWGGKSCGQALRVAAALAMIGRADDGASLTSHIGDVEMAPAIALVKALQSHAMALLAPSGDRDEPARRYLLVKLKAMPQGATVSDLQQACKHKKTLNTAGAIDTALDELEDAGYIRRHSQAATKPGRPPSPVIELHPELRRDGRL